MVESSSTAQKTIELSAKEKLQDKDEYHRVLKMMDDESETLLHRNHKKFKKKEKKRLKTRASV